MAKLVLIHFCWKFAFGGEVRPPVFNDLNTRVPYVGAKFDHKVLGRSWSFDQSDSKEESKHLATGSAK
ncbi:hypothetical protein RND71_032410 [Anisodus tanguticus]|uniref:Uncharacterized protein n=1 Tax=Anisodus tanguticus TaxID=243964 RepID=A0AAE1RCJ8_9SOLA|nr:hypothetical protein RND71_032410 [Anisodus tanguticus]